MKFKLDESLFDDDITFDEPSIKIFDEGHFDDYKVDDLDDDTFIYEPLAKANVLTDDKGEAVPGGPANGLDSGIASSLINLINDEWEAIQGYNDFRAMIFEMNKNGDGDYTQMLAVIDEVVNEENRHVGQLQELLKTISPNTESISDGEEEAEEQLSHSTDSGHEWVDGKLKVEMHQPLYMHDTKAEPSFDNPQNVDTICTLYDADDDM